MTTFEAWSVFIPDASAQEALAWHPLSCRGADPPLEEFGDMLEVLASCGWEYLGSTAWSCGKRLDDPLSSSSRADEFAFEFRRD